MIYYIIAANENLTLSTWSRDGATRYYTGSGQPEEIPGVEHDPTIEVDPIAEGIHISAPSYECPIPTKRVTVSKNEGDYSEYFLIEEGRYAEWGHWMDTREG